MLWKAMIQNLIIKREFLNGIFCVCENGEVLYLYINDAMLE